VRAYAIQSFFVMAAALALWRAVEDDRGRRWALAVLAGVFAIATHYFSLFALAALALMVALELPRMRCVGRAKRALPAVLAALAAGLAAMPIAGLALARLGAPYVPFDVFEWCDLGWGASTALRARDER
jgi:uncharacterized membrane protein